jgi:hypothetical protein
MYVRQGGDGETVYNGVPRALPIGIYTTETYTSTIDLWKIEHILTQRRKAWKSSSLRPLRLGERIQWIVHFVRHIAPRNLHLCE